MTKSKKRAEMTMHKILGDHNMRQSSVCTICGIIEGEIVIDSYKPVHIDQKDVETIVLTLRELAERVRILQGQISILHRDQTAKYSPPKRAVDPTMWPDPWYTLGGADTQYTGTSSSSGGVIGKGSLTPKEISDLLGGKYESTEAEKETM